MFETTKIEEESMNPDVLKAALDALESGDLAKMTEALKAIIAAAGSDESGEAPPADATMASADAPKPPAPGAPAPDAAATDKAAMSALLQVTGAKEPGEAVALLRKMRADVDALNANQAALDLSARRELIGELVAMRAETPATAWEGKAEDRKPVARLAAESVDSLRGRVVALRASQPRQPEHRPPTEGATTLTEDEEALTVNMTADQKKSFISLRASRRAR
jgi:hypothetical protein